MIHGESASQSAARIVLASTSPYRKALLERLGPPFRCRSPLIDEDALKDPALAPRKLACYLARAKGESLSDSEPSSSIIIGGDQLVSAGGKILGKPGSRLAAIEQLRSLSGRTHDLLTAVAVGSDGRWVEHLDVTALTMRALSLREIERYVEADEPWDCAGSYKIESRGITLFERIESQDQTAITGMPLIALTAILREFGVVIP